MALALRIGSVHVLGWAASDTPRECTCHEADAACAPPFVFSVSGQVNFRAALHHLTRCRRLRCRRLTTRVFRGMEQKLRWLMTEETLLGCVHIQPTLYGRRRVVAKRRDFAGISHHLAHCPRESCAQLRRALLLSIRSEVHPKPTTLQPHSGSPH